MNSKYNYEQISMAMIIKWIDKMDFLKKQEKALLLKISFLLIKNRGELYKIYDEINNEDKHFLIFNDEKLELSLENKKMIVSTLIDFSEDILPLGSVVILNNQELKDVEGRNLRIIITKRFLFNEKSRFYFTYSGTIYPIGTINGDKLLHFTGESIKEVVYKGYSDEFDLSYVLETKNELNLNKNIHSVIFANIKEKKAFENEISV